MRLRTYNLFISHSWNYGNHYDRLSKLLEKARYFRYKDYSVPADNPIQNATTAKRLRHAIRRKMSPCGIILVVAGVYATYSDWILKEIDMANSGFENPKPIVAVRPWGNRKISSTVRDSARTVVGWNSRSIVDAIRTHSITRRT